MQEVTLQQMLVAREARVALQKNLLNTYKTPLICFTMNVAGPIKTSPLIERAFREGVEALQSNLPPKSIRHRQIDISVTGCQAMLCVSMDPQKLKKLCVSVEDSCPLGRLFDMDVLDTDGTKLSREHLRGCIVCGVSGRECAAGRLHTVLQLQAATQRIISEYFFSIDCKRFADMATDSLLQEVDTTPKPGLVDRRNCGSHRDMDLHTFVKSAHTLTPYFHQCVEIGRRTRDRLPGDTFRELRQAGISAENTMYQATGGVNTHKGAIYSMGVICGALGRLWRADCPVPKREDILALCAEMTRDAVEADFRSMDQTTAGGRLYLAYGLTGIRGEVAAGFPSVAHIGLPVYQRELDRGLSPNDAGTVTLLHLLARVQDTNLYHRGGQEGAAYAAACAKRLLAGREAPAIEEIEALDEAFIVRNLSPGGCADLLAVTYFLSKLQEKV